MANICLLCCSRADSKEHYIPEWLSTACETKELKVVRAKSKGGVFTTPEPLGPLRDAKSRILCVKCNSKLGEHLEERVRKILSPYVAPNAIFTRLNLLDTEILVKWMMLRALEMSIVTKQSLLRLDIKDEILDICRSGRDRYEPKIWTWFTPSLEAVILKQLTMGCAVSESFFSTERGEVKSAGRGFWFFLQMNGLGLLLVHAPNAQRNNSQGYGLKLFPKGIGTVDTQGIRTQEVPCYENLRDVYSRLTRLNTEVIHSSRILRSHGSA
jgi:hypothetical protein